jgi:hypothetical protein
MSTLGRSTSRTPFEVSRVLKDDAGETEEARRLWQEAHDLYVVVEVQPGVAESAARLARRARRQGEP